MTIDPDLDFASYYKDGGDPDRDCKLLYEWHLALWGRSFPGIASFELEITYDRGYGMRLLAPDDVEFWLGSDGIIPTWSTAGWARRFAPDLAAEIMRDVDDFYRIASTIGGYIVFPRNRTGQTGWTINQARGMYSAIADRFDLTLECIRRHYSEPDAANPLGKRLAYYADFFALFRDFDTYVRFFLLDDLVNDDGNVCSLVNGEPLTDLSLPAVTGSVEEYGEYRRRSIAFVSARNEQIRLLGL